MRVVQITPGSGDNFYCENCLRDAALIRAMRDLGHDVVIVPMYLPLQEAADGRASTAPIFFGGVNVYLQQKSAFFRKTPRWLDRLFDAPALLRWVARKAHMTSAKDLSETTLSMLQAEQGRQKKELERLIEWLSVQDNKPDVVCLSNALLAGLARSVKARLGVPVVCLLQDEDGFLDALGPHYAKPAWQMLTERCRDVDAFISVSRYYADVMRQRLELRPDRVHVVYMGISLDGYEPPQRRPDVPTIGYLSRMSASKGLDTLVEAFIKLKKNDKLKDLKLRIAGGSTGDDEEFIGQIRRQLSALGLIDDVEFVAGFDRQARTGFLQSVSVLSVPERQPVAYGLYALEALAAGVPVVQPASGVFPELLDITGGGLLFEPNSADALAAALESLLLDPERARQLAERGREKILEKFHVKQTAAEMLCIYQAVAQQFHGDSNA
jgi:glycosyltransferase involved in cell wall biosynthesis